MQGDSTVSRKKEAHCETMKIKELVVKLRGETTEYPHLHTQEKESTLYFVVMLSLRIKAFLE